MSSYKRKYVFNQLLIPLYAIAVLCFIFPGLPYILKHSGIETNVSECGYINLDAFSVIAVLLVLSHSLAVTPILLRKVIKGHYVIGVLAYGRFLVGLWFLVGGFFYFSCENISSKHFEQVAMSFVLFFIAIPAIYFILIRRTRVRELILINKDKWNFDKMRYHHTIPAKTVKGKINKISYGLILLSGIAGAKIANLDLQLLLGIGKTGAGFIELIVISGVGAFIIFYIAASEVYISLFIRKKSKSSMVVDELC